MQINFFMRDDDREAFHNYVFSRGGYLTPTEWPSRDLPVMTAHADIVQPTLGLWLFKEDIFPRETFEDPDWLTPVANRDVLHVWGPGIEYLMSWQDDQGLRPGRLYMGLTTAASFVKPQEPPAEAYTTYAESMRAIENFYKSCCRYIRKRYRRDENGFYHSPGSDEDEASGVVKRTHHYACC